MKKKKIALLLCATTIATNVGVVNAAEVQTSKESTENLQLKNEEENSFQSESEIAVTTGAGVVVETPEEDRDEIVNESEKVLKVNTVATTDAQVIIETPDGYNEHDYKALYNFLAQTDEKGITNAEKAEIDLNNILSEDKQITWIEINGNKYLRTLQINDKSLVGDANFSDCNFLYQLSLINSNLENVNLDNCSKLTNVYLTTCNIKNLSTANLNEIKNLNLSNNSDLQGLDLSNLNININQLYTNSDYITDIDLSRFSNLSSVGIVCKNIKTFKIKSIQMESLNISDDANLNSFECDEFKISSNNTFKVIKKDKGNYVYSIEGFTIQDLDNGRTGRWILTPKSGGETKIIYGKSICISDVEGYDVVLDEIEATNSLDTAYDLIKSKLDTITYKNTTTEDSILSSLNTVTLPSDIAIKITESKLVKATYSKAGTLTLTIEIKSENGESKELTYVGNIAKLTSSSSSGHSGGSSSNNSNSADSNETEDKNNDTVNDNKTETNAAATTVVKTPSGVAVNVPTDKQAWVADNGQWLLFDRGNKATGWNNVNSTWYYLDNTGIMKTGWVKDNDKWYYLNGNGSMATGWVKENNTWYYLNGNGAMKTGWHLDNNVWYYLNNNGSMKTGWHLDSNGKWYYLNDNGSMAKDTYIDGYYVNANGEWE